MTVTDGPAFISFRAGGVGGGVTAAEMYAVRSFSPAFRWKDRTWANALTPLPKPERSDRLRGRDVWFVVHGFNTNRDRGIMSLGAMAQEYLGQGVQSAQYAGAAYDILGTPRPTFAPVEDMIPVLWPGDAPGLGILKGASYPLEIGDVYRTAVEFARLLSDPETRPARVNFITHSLGARVALDTLRNLAGSATPPAFGTVLMMAPATDDDVLDDPRFARVVDRTERFVVVSSFKDVTLEYAFPIGDVLERALHWTERASVRAMGRFGPRLKKDSPALAKLDWFEILNAAKQDHNDYNPWPWDKAIAAPVNGWSEKRWRAHRLTRHTGVDYDPTRADSWREAENLIVKNRPTIKD